MKVNTVPRLLSSLVWIDQYNECNWMTSFMEFMPGIQASDGLLSCSMTTCAPPASLSLATFLKVLSKLVWWFCAAGHHLLPSFWNSNWAHKSYIHCYSIACKFAGEDFRFSQGYKQVSPMRFWCSFAKRCQEMLWCHKGWCSHCACHWLDR